MVGQSQGCQSRVGVQRKHPFCSPLLSWYVIAQGPASHQEPTHRVPEGVRENCRGGRAWEPCERGPWPVQVRRDWAMRFPTYCPCRNSVSKNSWAGNPSSGNYTYIVAGVNLLHLVGSARQLSGRERGSGPPRPQHKSQVYSWLAVWLHSRKDNVSDFHELQFTYKEKTSYEENNQHDYVSHRVIMRIQWFSTCENIFKNMKCYRIVNYDSSLSKYIHRWFQ